VLLLIVFLITYEFSDNPLIFIAAITTIGSSIAFNAALFSINSSIQKRKFAKKIHLFISVMVVGLAITSKINDWVGRGPEMVFGMLWYCFAYAPLELKDKYQRWQPYSKNCWETLLLSSVDFIGVNLILIGILTTFQKWPGQYYLIYPGICILLIGLVLWNIRFKKEVVRRKASEDLVNKQIVQIAREKDRSENLLLNILPRSIAEELKEYGKAKARDYEVVSVLFTDFINFTSTTAKMTGQEIVAEINACFEAFDAIVDKYQIEKIKTIGDAYMAAGGLPVLSNHSVRNTVLAALEMQEFISNRKSLKDSKGEIAFEMRAGIHTGPIVAGIVGVKKFQYDVWGDTVNTASRMESNGASGMVNISSDTYLKLKDDSEFKFETRKDFEVKGKGMQTMYFVKRVKNK